MVISSRDANVRRRKMEGCVSHMRPIKRRERPSPVFSPRYFYCRATRWIGGQRAALPDVRRPRRESRRTPSTTTTHLCVRPAGAESHSRQANAINPRTTIIDLSYSHALPFGRPSIIAESWRRRSTTAMITRPAARSVHRRGRG